ncbi:helix-turn-helix domain-containing protein [Rhizobium tumorigenes]|uniref:helix-turn-helix domain-containing protein n=1 Tax=Rhizobium tumorigenes TaxID=2041385 RepID=UPI003C7D7663
MNLTAREFAQAFPNTTGSAPDRWMRRQRVEKAKMLLRATALPISQIPTACGFVSSEHFSRIFASIVGVTPATWRKHILN